MDYTVTGLDDAQVRLLASTRQLAEATGATGLLRAYRTTTRTLRLPGALVDHLRTLPDDRDGVVGGEPPTGLMIWFGGDGYQLWPVLSGD